MAKTATQTKPMSGVDRESFTKEGLKEIATLQAKVLKLRESLRNATGALKERTAEFHQGLSDGCQLNLKFKDEEAEDDEPEDLSAE